MKQFWETLCGEWQLGTPTRTPQPVSGGYMHKMYRLDTAKSAYAVKLLNPEVMSRPTALANYRKAEMLECVLEENCLPIVAALCRDGRKMHRIGEQYYYLFPWVPYQVLPETAVTPEHCAVIGGLLAQMHSLPCGEIAIAAQQPQAFTFDWETIAKDIQRECGAAETTLAETLSTHLELLNTAQNAYRCAVEALPPLMGICNADMDAKNVLWQENEPLIIDLECLEIGNPVNDLVQLSLSWSGGASGMIDERCLSAFLSAYRKIHPLPPLDWDAVSGLGFSWLDWLHYNLRRACGRTVDTQEERSLGIRQAQETLEKIRRYAGVQSRTAAQFRQFMHK